MQKLQFIAALAVAATYELWKQASGIWKALGTRQRVSDELKQDRMGVCRTCDLFFQPLGTCGSPLQKHKGPGIRPGCFCHMGTASGVLHDCWKFEMGREGGWPAELNSSYILKHEQAKRQ